MQKKRNKDKNSKAFQVQFDKNDCIYQVTQIL